MKLDRDILIGLTPFMVLADDEMNVAWASPAVGRRFGDCVGRRVADLIESSDDDEPLGPETLAARLGERLRWQLRTEIDPVPLTGCWVRSDEGLLLMASPVLRDLENIQGLSFEDFPEGDTQLTRLTMRDEYANSIAELNDVTKTLKKREVYLRTLLDSIVAGVVLIDAKTRKIVDVNPLAGEMIGASKEQIIGEPCALLCPKDESDCPVLDEGYSVDRREGALRQFNGGTKPVLKTVKPVTLDGNVHLIESFIDLSEIKTLESKLLQAQKLESVGQLASGIAHELNTPIQYISDNLGFLKDAYLSGVEILSAYRELMANCELAESHPEEVAKMKALLKAKDINFLQQEAPEAMAQAVEGVKRVSEIVHAMKDFSHPGTKEMTAININAALRNTMIIARNEWKYTADVKLELDESLPKVVCLPGEINQTLLNIIVNAAQAIAETSSDEAAGNGEIRIATRRVEDQAEIRISDTGPGIPEEIRPRIFDPFFTTKEVGEGSGQGLSIAHSVIVQKHGGSLDFETAAGVGTTFVIRLPLADTASAELDAAGEAGPEPQPAHS